MYLLSLKKIFTGFFMVNLAKTAGFCFGVRNALNVVESLLEAGFSVCTLGYIIHSPQVVDLLKKRGVRVVDSVLEVRNGEVLVIRSHGVGLEVYSAIKEIGLQFKDATCPFVRRIQKEVFKEYRNGRKILIAGNANHPEVKGILGYCQNEAFVFSSLAELKMLFVGNSCLKKEPVFLAAQTTFNIKVWESGVSFLKDVCGCENISLFCSICSATVNRQNEAILLSKSNDVVFVVGGRGSSNTRKIYELCAENCETFFVESLKDLENLNLNLKGKAVGLTAGASTPDFLIEEVYNKVLDICNGD